MMLTLAAIAALTCAEAARERDTTAVFFLAASSQGGRELARSLDTPLPEAGMLLDRIRILDRRLADCGPDDAAPGAAISASRRAP